MRTVEFKFDIRQVVQWELGTGETIAVVVDTCLFTAPGIVHYHIHWLGATKALNVCDVLESELRKLPSGPDGKTSDWDPGDIPLGG